LELLLTFAQWQFPLSQLVTENKFFIVKLIWYIYFCQKYFFLEKSIQLKVPSATVVSNCLAKVLSLISMIIIDYSNFLFNKDDRDSVLVLILKFIGI
jgi:hypothetical protein